MPRPHLTPFFKSAAGAANGVLENAINSHRNRRQQRDQIQQSPAKQTRSSHTQQTSTAEEVPASHQNASSTALTKVTTKTSKASKTSGTSYNPLVSTSSTYTNPSENIPPTPNLRAVDEFEFPGEGMSPTVGLSDRGLFGDNFRGNGVVNGQSPVQQGPVGVTNYRGVDTGPVAIPVAIPGMGSATIPQPRTVAGRERSFTIPRKPVPTRPVPLTLVLRDNGFETVPWTGDMNDLEKLGEGTVINRDEIREWEAMHGEHSDKGVKSKEAEQEQPKKPEIIETKEERKKRLAKEKRERIKTDLHHENPLHSHPTTPTTISSGAAPTTSSFYTSSPTSQAHRSVRRSHTAPITGFNFASLGGLVPRRGTTGINASEGLVDIGAVGPLGGMRDMPLGGMNGMEGGSARDRYSGRSDSSGLRGDLKGLKSAFGVRTGGYLRRASVSLKGMEMRMFGRSSSGDIGVGGSEGVENDGLGLIGMGERPNATMTSEYIRGGVDGLPGLELDDEMDAEAERKRTSHQSMILPSFEWEEEFTSTPPNSTQ